MLDGTHSLAGARQGLAGLRRSALVAAVAAFSMASCAPQEEAGGHHHARSLAGRPTAPSKLAREVSLTMAEVDGRMLFQPDRLEVGRNERIRFVIKNAGALDHEFVIGTLTENLEHAEEMLKFPDMAHSEANALRLASVAAGEINWLFDRPGEFDFSCLIPGHREAGMFGTIMVR